MRIKHVYIADLFGMFDHSIPMHLEDRITIIYGSNGIGKTTVLKMIGWLLNGKYAELARVPFSSMGAVFDNGEELTVEKPFQGDGVINTPTSRASGRREKHDEPHLIFTLLRKGEVVERYDRSQSISDRNIPSAVLDYMSTIVEGISRVDFSTWETSSGELLSVDDVIERYGDLLPITLKSVKATPSWLRELNEQVSVRLIQTDRLSFTQPNLASRSATKPKVASTVTVYSERLASQIQSRLAEYAQLSQKLDSTFPRRLIDEIQTSRNNTYHNLTDDQLRARFEALEQKRLQLRGVGVLGEDSSETFQVPGAIDGTTRNVLSVYLQDVEAKLNFFDDFAKRVDLLVNIANSHFTYKTMSVNKDDGFVFATVNGNRVAPSQLSSGEQHELVMLYDLLFNDETNSLILIDEPEISLHIDWQEEFIADLQKISLFSSFDILIATHSPQIVNDRWDLTAELHGRGEF